MDSNTKKKLLAKAEIDLFSFSTPNAYQNEMHESPEQDEELYRGIDILLTAHAPQILDSFAEFCKMVAHLLYLTGTTRELILNYIERNVPAGVGIEVKSFKLAQFPAELEKHIERNFDMLSDEEKMLREEFLAM